MIVFTSKAHGMKALDMADPTRLGLIILKYTQKSSASPSKNSARRKKKKNKKGYCNTFRVTCKRSNYSGLIFKEYNSNISRFFNKLYNCENPLKTNMIKLLLT